MPLEVVFAEIADLPRIVEIENDAFRSNAMNMIYFPNGRSAEDLKAHSANLLKQWKEDPTIRNLKVIDTTMNGEAIAFARWHVYLGDDTKYIKDSMTKRPDIPGANMVALSEAREVVHSRRAKIIRRDPHCYLQNLTTDPKQQGRGAGKLLTLWGCKVAQENGVPAYIESSPAAHALYEKCGFKDLSVIVFNLKKWGKDATHETSLMVRYPDSEIRS